MFIIFTNYQHLLQWLRDWEENNYSEKHSIMEHMTPKINPGAYDIIDYVT